LISISFPFVAGSARSEDLLQHLRIHDQRIDVVPDGLDMDVLVLRCTEPQYVVCDAERISDR
jgi:hypothetical protein